MSLNMKPDPLSACKNIPAFNLLDKLRQVADKSDLKIPASMTEKLEQFMMFITLKMKIKK